MRSTLLAISFGLGVFGCEAVPEGEELTVSDARPHERRGSNATSDPTPETTRAAELPATATAAGSANRPPLDGGGAGAATDVPAPPKTPAGEPAPSTFRRLDVRYPVRSDGFVVQCESPTVQLVWTTSRAGTDAGARWAEPRYTQTPGGFVGCGNEKDGHYPLVFASEAAASLPIGTYAARCVAMGLAEIYRIDAELDGHPSASFGYPRNWAGCE